VPTPIGAKSFPAAPECFPGGTLMRAEKDARAERAPSKRGRPPSGADEAIVAAALEIVTREGLSHLTTKEAARRAGVSEASVFYHFGDKLGLLRAVVLAGLAPLERFDPSQLADDASEPLQETLTAVARAFEAFFGSSLPIFEAIQADSEIRQVFAQGLVDRDLGPHRGVRFLAVLIEAMRRSGRIAEGVDADALAALLVGACFLRAWTRHLAKELWSELPDAETIAAALAQLVAEAEPGTRRSEEL
jgi:AcrR family transcriptional regulator